MSVYAQVKLMTFCYFIKRVGCQSGVISKNFNKGALGAMSGSGCGALAATPIFLKMET